MGIRIKHGKPETLLTAAQLSGQARRQEAIQKMQMEFDYRQSLRQQDMAIDLQMQERAKLWEIDKMQLRSQMDFQREEQQRQRKLDSIDSAIQQIDKEVLAGRITEQEAYPIKQKLEISKTGVSVPISTFAGEEEDRYGVRPYWMRGRDAPEGTPERQLYEAKMAEGISGERRGVVPYYLNPEFLRELPPDTAQDILMNKGIFFDNDEDFEAFLSSLESTTPTELPLADKQLDIGVQVEGKVRELDATTARQILIEADGDRDRARQIARQRGYAGIDEPTEEVEPVGVGVKERLEAGRAKFYKPSVGRFLTMSPLRLLMERRKAKKLVR